MLVALAGVKWLEHGPMHWRVKGLIPFQGHVLGLQVQFPVPTNWVSWIQQPASKQGHWEMLCQSPGWGHRGSDYGVMKAGRWLALEINYLKVTEQIHDWEHGDTMGKLREVGRQAIFKGIWQSGFIASLYDQNPQGVFFPNKGNVLVTSYYINKIKIVSQIQIPIFLRERCTFLGGRERLQTKTQLKSHSCTLPPAVVQRENDSIAVVPWLSCKLALGWLSTYAACDTESIWEMLKQFLRPPPVYLLPKCWTHQAESTSSPHSLFKLGKSFQLSHMI